MSTISPFASARRPEVPSPTTIGRRIGAYAVDVAIQGVIVGVAAVITSVTLVAGAAGGEPAELLAAAALSSGIVLFVALAVVVGYTLLQGGRGSIGQRLLGIRLADAETGEPIGFWRALVRNLVWGLAGSIIVGYFSPLFDKSPRRQGWHDKVARAFVVGARTAEPDFTPPATAAAPAPAVESAVPRAAAVGGAPPRFAPGAAHATTGTPSGTPAFASRTSAPGLISFVPGVAPTADARALAEEPRRIDEFSEGAGPEVDPAFDAAAFEATELVRGPRTVPAPEPAASDDATVVTPPRRVALVALTWDSGERVAVYGTTLFGRNPAAEAGAAVVAVRDETLSLSKTHFEIGADAAGPWVTDRHSTNGTLLVRGGDRRPLPPGARTPLVAGDRLEFGDRSLLVGDDA